MRFSSWLLLLVTMLVALVMADDTIKCSSSKQCPESSPCCSQYGVCGTGAYCLGGCDIRYSFNLSSCMPMPRMGDLSTTFDNTDQIELQTKYLGNYSESDWVYTGYIDTHDDALLMQMPNGTSGTVISSTKYLWYGSVRANMKTSRDNGVITAFILFSDVQDEIDFESVGYNLTFPETNFYAQGITNYTNAKNYNTSNTYENYHSYGVDWYEDRLEWYLDDKKVRTLFKNGTYNSTSKRYNYPQTPSRIQFSLWPGGASSNAQGTIEWAGGAINWDSDDIKKYGYYYAYIKDIKVKAFDLPEKVRLDGSNDTSKLHAFLYNSTDGDQENVYLTNKKTWLGSQDATGFDPDNDSDNESDDESETTIVHSSGSLKSTEVKTSTKEKTADVPGKATSTTSDESYDTSNAIGGFVQNSQNSASTTGGSGSSSANQAGRATQGALGVVAAIAVGVISFVI